MIFKYKDYYKIACDYCGEVMLDEFEGFYKAVNYKKEQGWRSKKVGDRWQEICPSCQVYIRKLMG